MAKVYSKIKYNTSVCRVYCYAEYGYTFVSEV